MLHMMRGELQMGEISKQIQSYWNRRSQDFSAVRRKELASRDADAWQSYIMRYLPQGRSLRILDIGTGPGFLAILMARLGHDVTAIDSSTGMIQEACRNAEEYHVSVDFQTGDAQALPFAPASFDVVLSRNLTWNLPDAVKAYRDWYRVLRDGGLLLNFDSDYGPVRFTSAASEEKNIHHYVDSDLIRECESLKDALAISRECRPAWDMYRLQDIGFTDCQCAEDIRPIVHISSSMQYDSAPLFCLSAHKSSLAWTAH